MAQGTVGVNIQAGSARAAVEQIAAAEHAGIPATWGTIGMSGGQDPMAAFAAAGVQTERVLMGTCIIQTWPRHPIVIAQQALAIESLAPGRFRLGIGPAHQPAMESTYGVTWRKPLTQLREYLTVLRALFDTGEVDFAGEHVVARTKLRGPVAVPVMASALRPKSFELCGELADGAISWMCPRTYLVEEALPALRRGAEAAGRPAPPLVVHVPVMVTSDPARARAGVRGSLGYYAQSANYRGMFERAGFPIEDTYSDALLDDLVVYGSAEEVAAGLVGLLDVGMGEVLAHPVIDPDDRAGSIESAFGAIALAAQQAAS
jgi:F420-dependent oxidoreductase-like protein